MKYRYITFDLDGTLTDPAEGICACICYALGKGGYPVGPMEDYYPWIGPPLRDSFMKYAGADAQEAETLTAYYRERFSTVGLFENTVYPGMPKLLNELKNAGARLAVATGKPTPYTLRILEHFDLLKYFDYVSGTTLDDSIKYKETVISIALDRLGATDKTQCVHIGDRDNDVIGARKNGIASIFVLYGYGSKEEADSSGADITVKDISQLRSNLFDNQR